MQKNFDVYLHFSSSLQCVLIFILSYLLHGLFKSFKILGNFSHNFLLLISNVIPLWSDNTLRIDLNYFYLLTLVS